MNWFVLPVRFRKWLVASCAGASVFQILGCSQEVSDILTSGFANASITLFSTVIQAFFTALNRPSGSSSVITAELIDYLPAFLT